MNNMIAVWGRGLVCAAALALAACNHDDSSSGDSQTPSASRHFPTNPTRPDPVTEPGTDPGPQPNVAPQIAGSPGGEVQAGARYDFKPSASDADGDSLSFTILGKPSWATFNTVSGRVSGTPGAADVGSYENIVISVSDGATTRTLPEFAIDVVAAGSASGSVTLAWEPPTQNTDGSPLTNLSGYRIHYGTASGRYDQTVDVNNAGVTSYLLESLAPGTYFFAISAMSSNGAESDTSREASKTIWASP